VGDCQQIRVDLDVPLSASGQDDLLLLRGYYRGASWEWPLDEPTWRKIGRLGFDRLRLINVDRSEVLRDESAPGGLRFVPSKRLSRALADCRRYRLKPHIIVGQSQPVIRTVNARGQSRSVGTEDAAYLDYANAFLQHVALEEGVTVFDLEVGNEPDISAAPDHPKEPLPFGSRERYQAYITMYDSWARACDQLTTAHPELRVRLGGPAVSSYSFAFGELNWVEQFLHDVADRRLRLDFVSMHFYGNNGALAGRRGFGPYPTLAGQIRSVRNSIQRAGLGRLPIYLTELAPTWKLDSSPAASPNGNNVGAAWTAAALIELVSLKVEEAMQLVLRDHPHDSSSGAEENWHWPALLTSDGRTPKALYNVFRMFEMLPGSRVRVLGQRGSIGALASAAPSAIGILVFNYDWDYENSTDRAEPERVVVSLRAIPDNFQHVSVSTYLVDGHHSNAYCAPATPGQLPCGHATLQLVAKSNMSVDNRRLDLPPTTLPPSSVTLWLLEETP